MRLNQLVKPISEMSDDELLTRLREVRRNREVVRPAAKQIVERVEKKASNKKLAGIQGLLEGMSPEDKAALLKQLEADESATS